MIDSEPMRTNEIKKYLEQKRESDAQGLLLTVEVSDGKRTVMNVYLEEGAFLVEELRAINFNPQEPTEWTIAEIIDEIKAAKRRFEVDIELMD